ncbi:serine protein kinase Sky1 [Arthroderma uncinatum]|uniref:serine protein kinase Sky1 n=1 Tax=Arthroderma uncinatum TaxID=74035 RepID=UPI00144A65DD|nr:serine protein kinase Sky1 [Arthroderma uncinatum]KAF3481876.1 serine protein kinase Sky1 [Arthroderma uncinatum]
MSTTQNPISKLSEESYQMYRPGGYHPARLGDMFDGKYQVVKKLGYGEYSTVWLAHDTKTDDVVALKVLQAEFSKAEKKNFEVEILRFMKNDSSTHPGKRHILGISDDFQHHGPNGNHICLVHEATGPDLARFQRRFPEAQLPVPMVKRIAKQFLLGLDYLHRFCKIVHTDIKPGNILIEMNENEPIALHIPSADGSEPVDFYMASEPLPMNSDASNTGIFLADFGTASWADKHLTELIQPRCLRAPEVLLEAKWDSSTDIWNAGCVIYELMEGKILFDGRPSADGSYAPEHHLSQMMALFGQFPKGLLDKGNASKKYFDSEGNLKGIPALGGFSVGGFIENKGLSGQEKLDFVHFLESMLVIAPERRKPAHALLDEPWLNKEY